MNQHSKTIIFIVFIILLLVIGVNVITSFKIRTTKRLKGYEVHGIDVSHYQSQINWNKVQNASIDFVFIKATEGKDFKDPKYKYNWRSAKEKNILRGAYHFYRPSVYSHIQAANFIRTVQLKPGDLPPVLDLEETDNRSKAIIVKGVRNWLNIIESHYGVKPIIYVNKNWYDKYIKGNFDDYVIWVAAYTIYPKPKLTNNKQWHFWQYTNKGQIDGIRGKVDLNVFNGSKKELQQFILSVQQ